MKNRLDSYKMILASGSPRRTELLRQIGLEHDIIVSNCEEKITSEVPQDVVQELASQKAEDVYEKYKELHEEEQFLVIGADTIVAIDGLILGKPKNREDACKMISLLQGNTHQVYTGVAILWNDKGQKKEQHFYECSNVEVYPMTDQEILDYVDTKEPMDKAGAYGIQGRFAAYIKGIHGDYNNIVGLPVGRIYQEIKMELGGKTDV